MKATHMLESFPEAGRIVPEIGRPTIREVLKNDYRIVYRIISSERIDILRIHSSARPWRFCGNPTP
ncbi:type II toxin-antitoxin system RelE/ParE family toxin [Hymenobacter psoromatis]|uniref:type II toxin-antitoxin system RelE/ParE family toxin n=1 Tax=Hymenobacter psoromatis TaxID=1484116 RepID=UPI0039FD4809